jgi:hypothetical protein
LRGNADHCDAINKELEEEEDKETEGTSADKEEEETTGRTSKNQETMDLPSMHELQKSRNQNQHTKLK